MLPETAEAYDKALLGLIDSLRHDTGDPDLPFVCVQIGRYAMRADEKTSLAWKESVMRSVWQHMNGRTFT